MTLEYKHRMENLSLDPEPLPGIQGGRGQCHSSFLAFLLIFFLSLVPIGGEGYITLQIMYCISYHLGGGGGMEVTGI